MSEYFKGYFESTAILHAPYIFQRILTNGQPFKYKLSVLIMEVPPWYLLSCMRKADLHNQFLIYLQATPDVSASILPVPEQPQVGLVNLVGQAVPPPPPITGNVDPTKIEEIRRTIYVGNLNTNVSHQYLLCFVLLFRNTFYCIHVSSYAHGETATVNFLHYSNSHFNAMINCVGVGIHQFIILL